jgi:hypothetical protein
VLTVVVLQVDVTVVVVVEQVVAVVLQVPHVLAQVAAHSVTPHPVGDDVSTTGSSRVVQAAKRTPVAAAISKISRMF